MGRSSQQPYLYQPVTHAPFNPKAYTQSVALAQNTPRRPKPDGPLITFNRHPDHYDNLPYGRHVGVPTMSKGSKKRVLWARKVQMGWRVLQWPVAVAVLVCVAMMKGVPSTQSWILRLPPAFDVVIQTYAIWHLAHPATKHPPASAASYHAFALAMDIGFIAFAVFTHILTRNQFTIPAGTEGRWRTVLNTDQGDNTILQVAMLTSIVSAGLHAATVIISGYLIYMFRKIADLPPDMNPLEDNLTSRSKQSKHKYKNSDLSTLIGQDKRFSEISARDSNRTLVEEQDLLRMSQMSEKLMGVDTRSSGVSFFQSRDGQAYAYSPHNPDTARHSWHVSNPSTYQPSLHSTTTSSPKKNRQSRALEQDTYGASRTMSPMPAAMPRIAKRASATPNSPIPIYNDNNEHERQAEEDTNWEVLSGVSGSSDADDFDPYRQRGTPVRGPDTRGIKHSDRYEQIAQHDFADHDGSEFGAGKAYGLGLGESPSQPLRMNPPTPEPTSAHHAPVSPLSRLSQGYANDKENENDRTTTMMSQDSVSQYSESDAALEALPNHQGQGQGKSRFYTDLASAMRGVRHHPAPTQAKSVAGSVHTHLSASTNASSGYGGYGKAIPATRGDLRIKPSGTVVRKPLKSFDEANGGLMTGYTVAKASPSRVVSRSGVDVVEGDLGMGRRRDVSGKVAEEGRGGGLWRRISGRHPSR